MRQSGTLIVRYQREFADVAWAAFRHEILPDDMLAELDATLPPDQRQRSLAAMTITWLAVNATTIRSYPPTLPAGIRHCRLSNARNDCWIRTSIW
jgi:hypothetical protein